MELNEVESSNNFHIAMFPFFLMGHVPEFTRKLGVGIKSIYYITTAAVVHAFSIVLGKITAPALLKQLRDLHPGYQSQNVVLLPGREIRSMLVLWKPFGLGGLTFYQRFANASQKVTTCREIEGHFYDYLSAHHKRPMLLTGPVYGLDDSNKNSPPLEDMWAKWLGGFEEAGTVVFCAFRNQLILEKDQFQELVLGFELTGLTFFYIFKPPAACATIEKAFPSGFEERVKGRGVVFGGWVQQTAILSYPLVGCFIMNTMILVKELKVAIEVEREENGWFSKESLSKTSTTMMDKENELGVSLKNNLAKWRRILPEPE
ncbi:LOW QUALITY PROTEIN: hypothetical protein PRUPE_4G242900 [Prunus persica]|uniref:Anthocyanidin 3-O-glucosyltransferase n=1 Tax=Prunus persica TaxID=3760 RepID=A0A251PQ96_PRUPE|nr:LOW QUALITY PROTEIN: hypothetical protein PRUPE_4G242900 [Prunus persica]